MNTGAHAFGMRKLIETQFRRLNRTVDFKNQFDGKCIFNWAFIGETALSVY